MLIVDKVKFEIKIVDSKNTFVNFQSFTFVEAKVLDDVFKLD